MKFVLKLLSLSVLAQSLVGVASAVVLINPPPPYPQHLFQDTGYTIYYAGSSSGSPSPVAGVQGFYNAGAGYRFLNVTGIDDPNLVLLDVSSNLPLTNVTAGQHVVVTVFTTATAGNEIPLTGAGVPNGSDAPAHCTTTSSCQGSRTNASFLSATYTPGSVLRLSFSLSAMCATPGVSTGTLNFCNGAALNTLTGNTYTQSLVVVFSAVSDYVVTGASSGLDSLTTTLSVSDIPPTVSCPQLNGSASTQPEDYYFPGDQRASISASQFAPSQGVGSSGSGAVGFPVSNLVVFASRNATPAVVGNNLGTTPAAETSGLINAYDNGQPVTGFVNTTTGADNGYFVALYAQNTGGIISPTACTTDNSGSGAFKIFTQPVSGVLTESKCFIATAAYHDGRAAPVMMLRHFRDEVLTQSWMGRKFIETYYHYSPALAEWAWDKPIIRSFALRALAPIEMMAWAILKWTHAEESSSQPYIDSIKKKLDAESPRPTDESYIESERKKLDAEPAPQPGDSYSEKLKKEIGASPGSENYSDQQKKVLPPEKNRDSPIQMVKENRDHPPIPERPPITTALGFRLGVSPGFKVENSNGSVSFADMYGSGWQPDLWFHYEKQFVHSENFGSLALGGDFGVSYAEAFGRLKFPFGSKGTLISQTKFSFLQLPLAIDAYYRFNLLRILRPYVGVGLGSMFYTEIRKDDQGDKRGASIFYTGSVGASLLLDFLDSDTALDSYLSNGIQHTYLFVEYTNLNTFNKSGVTFERNGIYAGFLLEY